MAAESRRGDGGQVSLTSPRPETARSHNEYVDTPLRYENNNKKGNHGGPGGADEFPVPVHARHPAGSKKGGTGLGPAVVSGSPGIAGGRGPDGDGLPPGRPPPAGPETCSIICQECGKCRCEACRQPRAPPSTWLCSDFCYCSLDTCVDYASCLCCVKGLMYHCGSGEDSSWADDPCSCSGSRWLARWSCLAVTSLCLPCLWCYCPLRGCADLCERTYAACTQRGCTCKPQPLLDPR